MNDFKSDEYKKYLAANMISPIRCGGLYYYNGNGVYKMGEHFVPDEILSDQQDKLDEWFKSHDHQNCIMLWKKLMRSKIKNE